MSQSFDVIIIGSGLGGLSTASLLTQVFGKRVLLLERHFKFGGYTHTFKRAGGYRWDVGLHYVGTMAPHTDARKFFDLVTRGQLQWNAIQDPFDRFVFPEVEFALRKGSRQVLADLIDKFPHEKSALESYFRDVMKTGNVLAARAVERILPSWVAKTVRFWMRREYRLASMTTKEYLDGRFHDPALKAILAAQWGDYGLAPSESSFLIHSTVAFHYWHGGYYPAGGSERIAGSILPIIKERGEAHADHEVTEILIEKGRAKGVRTRHMKTGELKEWFAPVIVSDAGARRTYLDLIPPQIEISFRDTLRNIPPSFPCITLYLGLKDSPEKLGVHGENFWIFDELDHDAIWNKRSDLAKGQAHFAYVSFPSLKDPEHSKAATAEIIAPIDPAVFDRWKSLPWSKRGEEYQALKDQMAKALIEFVEKRIPGFQELIVYQELSTPLSAEHFTAHPLGEVYGIPYTPARLKWSWLSAKTPIRGLYLTGADAFAHGIVGALMSSWITVAAIFGLKAFPRVFRALKERS